MRITTNGFFASKKRMLLAALAALALLLLSLLTGRTDTLVVRVIDVGQGDAIFASFPNGSTMLVDAGTASAGRKVVQTLRSLGVKKIDILVATHPHADHIGGMFAVIEAFPIGKVWDSGYAHGSRTQQRFLEAVRDRNIRFGRPKAGFAEEIGDALVEVLAPVKEISGTSSDANNNSIVLRVSLGEVSFLLAADMEKEQRASVGRFPETTVLKASHHGARNGTDEEFLRMVRPRVAVISYGEGNSYGHPHREVLDMLRAAGVGTYTTAAGDVVVETDGESFTVRQEGRRSGAVGEGTESIIANRSSGVFHLPTCDALPAERNRVFFDSGDEASEAGFRPCGRCIS